MLNESFSSTRGECRTAPVRVRELPPLGSSGMRRDSSRREVSHGPMWAARPLATPRERATMNWLAMPLGVLLLAGCATMDWGSPQAIAELKNSRGEVVGSARFWEDASGVRIVATVKGVPVGKHGFHIHSLGKCDPPNFVTAGPHFNPEGKKHGLRNPDGPHAADLPNLDIGADGAGGLEYVTKLITLAPGPTSLFDADGSALVLHANPDDDVTDPMGNSGSRIACGVVRRAWAAPGKTGY